MASDPSIRTLAAAPDTEATMPALFIGHSNPMNAIEDHPQALRSRGVWPS